MVVEQLFYKQLIVVVILQHIILVLGVMVLHMMKIMILLVQATNQYINSMKPI